MTGSRPICANLRPPMRRNAEAGEQDEEAETGPIQLAIVGRPNVGKSTLINRLIGEDRLLTGPEPGITRDAIAIEWEYRGRRLRLIDTAGMRRRANVTEKLEKLSVADTLRAVRFAHVAILVLDANDKLEKQDLHDRPAGRSTKAASCSSPPTSGTASRTRWTR